MPVILNRCLFVKPKFPVIFNVIIVSLVILIVGILCSQIIILGNVNFINHDISLINFLRVVGYYKSPTGSRSRYNSYSPHNSGTFKRVTMRGQSVRN